MQQIYCFLSYSNPSSQEFRESLKDFYKLEKWQQGIAIITAIAAGIFGFGISAFAAFRFTVEKLQKGGNAVADRTNTLFQETISSSKSKNSSPLMFRETASLINNAKQFAPDKNFPIELEIEEEQFIIWYDSDSSSAIIKKADERDEAITISNSSFLAKNPGQMKIVEGVYEHLLELKEQFNRERRQFQPQTLKIIKCFFEGEKGNKYHAGNPLKMDNGNIRLWPEKRNNPRAFYLHVRVVSDAKEIKISLDHDGQINAVELNDKKRNPLFLFEEDGIWKNILTLCFHNFLKKNALKRLRGPAALRINGKRVEISGIFGYHNAIISELPEYVLSKLAPKQMYRYLKDNLTTSPGVDLGGLKRQMFSELARHLFDGSPNREIQVIEGIPALRNSESNREKELLEMAGKNLIRTALTDNDVTLGNILDPVVYECFNLLIKFDNKTTDDVFMQAAQLLCKTKQLQFLFEVYNRPRIFTDEEKDILENILMIENVKKSMTALEARELAKNHILDCYKKQIMAIHYMVKGALGSSEEEQFAIRTLYEASFDHLTPEKFCEQIQGIKFDPKGIADRIFTDSDHPVVKQKTAWLKEYILDSDEEEIKRVLMAITGSTTITAKTKIEIIGTRVAHHCVAHTCRTFLEVPITHTSVGTDAGTRADNKQLFLNNFKLIYSENGFDMG